MMKLLVLLDEMVALHTNLTFIAPVVDSKMEMVGENTLSDKKSHHRCRRKKHDYGMVVDALRVNRSAIS
ncbi:unnamed protein product [Lupinus luteus]|uniref:Uncharacterized protein n=1 Tax=Lupinus luteus TaxID=3873 RepID=A0AAV1XRH2_LUPLU